MDGDIAKTDVLFFERCEGIVAGGIEYEFFAGLFYLEVRRIAFDKDLVLGDELFSLGRRGPCNECG